MNTSNTTIFDGVEILVPKQIHDGRGAVRRFIDEDSNFHFGECYTTSVYKGIIKGFHGYKSKTIWYCVPIGMVKLVLWDTRPESKTFQQAQVYYSGAENYFRIKIPPMILNAFEGIADLSLAVVMATEKFNEERTIRKSMEEFPLYWDYVK